MLRFLHPKKTLSFNFRKYFFLLDSFLQRKGVDVYLDKLDALLAWLPFFSRKGFAWNLDSLHFNLLSQLQFEAVKILTNLCIYVLHYVICSVWQTKPFFISRALVDKKSKTLPDSTMRVDFPSLLIFISNSIHYFENNEDDLANGMLSFVPPPKLCLFRSTSTT